MPEDATSGAAVTHGEVDAADDASATASPYLRVTCWGTRGSIPSPGPATAHFGGNTPCIEVRSAAGGLYILDAGTGIRVLGRRLEVEDEPVRAELFLTHFHWDHIQGIPFFTPLYDRRASLRVHGPPQADSDIATLFARQMTTTFFPVPFEALAADLAFRHLDEEPWTDGAVRVASLRVKHPSNTHGYRLSAGGADVAYIPDNELSGTGYEVGSTWYDDLVGFLDGVELLIHDAMYTDEELTMRRGWGHSTHGEAVRLALDAGVKRLLFFHHAPDRDDVALRRLLEPLAEEGARRGLDVAMAAEGEEHLVQEWST